MSENSFFKSLLIRDFQFLWIASTCSAFAMQMRSIAQGWLIYDLTSSPLALTWVMLSFIVPSAIFSLIGGVVADRVSKKNIMIYSQLINAISTFILAYIVFVGEVTFEHFIYFGILNGAVGSLSMPANFSIVPEIVRQENLINATALQTSTFNLSSIVGPILAGSLIALFSIGEKSSFYSVGLVFFVITSLLFIATFLTLFIKHHGKPENTTTTSSLEDFKEGFNFVWKEKTILGLLLMGLLPSAFGKASNFLLPAFNQDVISGGPEELGILSAGMGVGALLGSLLLANLSNFKRKGKLMLGTAYGWALAILTFALTGSLTMAILFGAVAAFFGSIFGALNMSLIQLQAPQYIRGRVISLLIVMSGVMPLAVVPIGGVAEYLGVSVALAFAAMMVGLSVWILNALFPKLKGISNISETNAG
ncbi:MAG: MFS transporter [Porticoccaceae bacterium]|nr:MFS transporter [Porticoccaceae bacterium]